MADNADRSMKSRRRMSVFLPFKSHHISPPLSFSLSAIATESLWFLPFLIPLERTRHGIGLEHRAACGHAVPVLQLGTRLLWTGLRRVLFRRRLSR